MGRTSPVTPVVEAVGSAVLWFVVFTATVHASDPEPTTDFVKPPAGVTLGADFFTSGILRHVKAPPSWAATGQGLYADRFPALQGLGVSMALNLYPPGTVNAPHYHPRGSEMMYVIDGSLEVGFVDTNNTLFRQRLHKGDVFVVPRAMIHFQVNTDKHSSARALLAFSSSQPGLLRLPGALFGSHVSDKVLKTSFGVSDEVLEQLRRGSHFQS